MFSDFPIKEQKIEELAKRWEELEILEDDVEENFITGSGKGGQKVNRSQNCVDLHHTPTGVRIQCQKDRSLILNRFFARRMLADAIEKEKTGKIKSKDLKAEKIRKQKKRRSRRSRSKSADPENKESDLNTD